MCQAPYRLQDGQQVACRSCPICRANRVNDIVGRCLAEQSSSGEALALTLTYAGDGPETASLRYSDVQNFLKRLRAAGHQVRYICAGEYGTKKGRAHWHMVLFFKGKAPPYPGLESRVNWEWWPHGFTYFQRPDLKGFRYLLKYALKSQDEDGFTRRLGMSKKPPLGYDFFMRFADDVAQAGLPLHSPVYSFLGLRDGKGQHRQFWLQGRMRELMLERYCQTWERLHGTEPPQTEFLVERYLDKLAAARMEAERVRSFRSLEDQEIRSWKPTPVRQLAWLALPGKRGGLVVAYDNGTADLKIGASQWLISKPDESESGVQLAELVKQLSRCKHLSRTRPQQIAAWLQSQWSPPG